MPRILPATESALREAADRFRAGRLTAFPTETVYGLGGATLNPEAVARLYALKGRPADNPLIAHVLDEAAARALTARWDDRASALARVFWPGPLTLVLPRAAHVPPEAAGGRDTIAIRSPAHPVARRLLEAFGGPVSAPSANRSGHVSPTTARHVADDFADAVLDHESSDETLLILDGGACEVGIESTVLDLSTDPPTLLRPGSISREAIEAIIGPIYAPSIDEQGDSPGTRRAHYAPRTRSELLPREALRERLHAMNPREPAAALVFDAAIVPPPHRALVMPAHAAAYAARLYSALREADDLRLTRLLIELPPSRIDLWASIHDRLARAVAEPETEATAPPPAF